jgi:hypothetical protein
MRNKRKTYGSFGDLSWLSALTSDEEADQKFELSGTDLVQLHGLLVLCVEILEDIVRSEEREFDA